MHKLEMLKETLCEELEKVAKKDQVNQSDLEIIFKLASSIKNIDKILEASSYGSYGRSYDNSYGRSYDYSYGRRGRDGDSDGRYSEGRNSRGYSESSYDYSRRMHDKFRSMMEDTSNDRERDAIRRCMEQLERD